MSDSHFMNNQQIPQSESGLLEPIALRTRGTNLPEQRVILVDNR